MEKPEYFTRLRKIKEALPKCYGVITRAKHPKIKPSTLYNVVGKESYNVDALLALEDTFPIK